MRRLTGILILGLLMILSACKDEETTPDYNITANAGSDQNVEVGEEVVLDGTASVDESGEGLQIEWSFESRPDGSSASIQNANSLVAGFIPDVAGNYIAQLSVANNFGNSFDNVTITADDPVALTVELDGNITENTILEKLNDKGMVDYIVTADINVSANLEIESGVIVEFQSGRSMRITQDGSIKAIGTGQDSIVFRGTIHQPGHWKGLRVDSNNPENELAYMQIKHGGSEGIGSTSAERTRMGNLILMTDAVRLTARNMTLSEGSGHGIFIYAVNNANIQLSENIYTANDKPAYADVTLFNVFDNESDYTGNADDFIASTEDGTIASDATWPRLNVPFQLPGVDIDGDLTIEAGAEFVVTHDKGIYVSSDGSINAIGEQANPIIFRGIFDERGHWNGIRIISNNPLNQLEYVEIYNGGYDGIGATTAERSRKTSLMLDQDARAEIRNVTISNSLNYPFWIRGGGNLNIEFESNNITGNEHAGWVDARYFHILDGSSSFTGNDTDRISSDTDVSITQNRTWKKVNVPYALPQVTINESAVLTIEAGAQFEANSDAFIYVNDNSAIRVMGEENDVVAFSGQIKVPGAWRGLRIRTGNPENQLSYMELRHGGQNGIGATTAERDRVTSLMLDEDARIAINNIAIHESLGYAFWIRHVNDLNITFANNTFSGNENLAMVDARYFHVLDGESSYTGNNDDIISSGTNTTATGSITWNKLDVPYELPDIVAVEGDLVIEAGAKFKAAQHGGIDVLESGSILAVGTAGDKIEFTGGITTPGHWRGINVRSSNSGNEISHFILRHTGSNGFGAVTSDRNRRQAIQVWGGYLKIDNGEISDSTGDGIKLHAGGTADLTDVTYSGIDGENEVGF